VFGLSVCAPLGCPQTLGLVVFSLLISNSPVSIVPSLPLSPPSFPFSLLLHVPSCLSLTYHCGCITFPWQGTTGNLVALFISLFNFNTGPVHNRLTVAVVKGTETSSSSVLTLGEDHSLVHAAEVHTHAHYTHRSLPSTFTNICCAHEKQNASYQSQPDVETAEDEIEQLSSTATAYWLPLWLFLLTLYVLPSSLSAQLKLLIGRVLFSPLMSNTLLRLHESSVTAVFCVYLCHVLSSQSECYPYPPSVRSITPPPPSP
jgi:hypothetical protein